MLGWKRRGLEARLAELAQRRRRGEGGLLLGQLDRALVAEVQRIDRVLRQVCLELAALAVPRSSISARS